MTSPPITPSLAGHLPDELRIGQPDHAPGLTVFPLLAGPGRLEYRSFAQGVEHGVTVSEREGEASVNDLTIVNPMSVPVLLYDGEEVLGAQQNRTFDVSVLVAAGAKLEVPVSCVEAGRWDGARHDEAFSPAPQTAYPRLRRAKHEQVRAALDRDEEARADQSEVWSEVASMARRMDTTSDTGAMHDIYDQRRQQLGTLRDPIRLHDEQVGALVMIGGAFSVLDLVSRADVFAALHGPLVDGYALDALDLVAPGEPAGEQSARGVLDDVAAQTVTERDGIGMARELRFASARVTGAGLLAGDELVQLMVFAADNGEGSGANGPSARIRRPSRRRAT